MNNITQLLNLADAGDNTARELLVQSIYQELHQLAKHAKSRERSASQLQTTEVLNEACVRLLGATKSAHWNSRGHFFTAAAITMRRVLVDLARQRNAEKRGGDWRRVELEEMPVHNLAVREDLIALDAALAKLEGIEPDAYELVHLRYFAGFTMEQAAETLGLSKRSAERLWSYAKAWLMAEIRLSMS